MSTPSLGPNAFFPNGCYDDPACPFCSMVDVMQDLNADYPAIGLVFFG